MNLRKWMTMFGLSIILGGVASLITGLIMLLGDSSFRVVKTEDWLFNIAMMFLAGLSLGAFAHMGFFAYMMVNYIARSIFRRPYLWVALQGFLAVFVLIEIVYWTYDSEFHPAVFWAVPLALAAVSTAVAWRKVYETTSGAWVPTLFFMIAGTTVEALPGFQSGNASSLVFTLIPLFVCNGYHILRLHHILDRSKDGKRNAPAAAAEAR
ncbi:KinB-signaling pathway activation protein [Cohnella fermenti]|uniref:KinB signaling pathway activation protein n=1 Tax=Cohnella fermenti TaxID=2565925 RepID=A0A4S4BVL9_9BACL|nr:KinB-signaling pathway activation protein [Cohnella fermenti]THF79179.1 KinB signaling pathway activation protein [Cohnella fermenti]